MRDKPPSPEPERRCRQIAWAVVAALGVLLPFVAASALRVDTSSSDVLPWLPAETEERRVYGEFEEVFGPEDFWIVSLADSDDPADFERLREALVEANERSEPRLLARIRSGKDLLEGLSEAEAERSRRTLRGIFFDREGVRPLVLMEGSSEGFRDRSAVYEGILQPVAEETGFRLMAGGSGFLGVMADRESRFTLQRITPLTFVLSSALALVLLRCLKLTVIAMLASGFSALLSIAIIETAGETLSHLLVIVPSLAQLLALSNAIHFIHYFEEAYLEEHHPSPAWRRALRQAWLPTVAASLTTAVGFSALLISSVPVVQSFATFGALGVLGSMAVVLSVVPAGLVLSAPRPAEGDWMRYRLIPWFTRLAAPARVPLGAALTLVLLAAVPGLALLKTDVRMEGFFAEDSEFQESHRWFEREFGNLQPCQLMGRFDSSTPLAEQLQFLADLHRNLEATETADAVFSPFSLGGPEMRRLAANPSLAALAAEEIERRFQEENVLAVFGGRHYWKLTVFHEAVPDFASSVLMREIAEALEATHAAHPGGGGEWTVTGIYPLFGAAQHALLEELLRSFITAFLLITPLTILLLRDLKLGLLGVFGNLFPVVLLFGSMGYIGIRIDIATMVIASVAFGVAIDDTIHFLVWTGRALRDRTRSMVEVVAFASQGSGPAIIKTSMIICIGMLAFLLGDFGPPRRFALCTSVVLVLAAVGVLVLLPALMSGLFARLFRRPQV